MNDYKKDIATYNHVAKDIYEGAYKKYLKFVGN